MFNRSDADLAPEAVPVYDMVMLGWCCGVTYQIKES